MCGIVLVATNALNGFTVDEMHSYAEMMIINQFRGSDSTGSVGVLNDSGYIWCKEVGPPNEMFKLKRWKEQRNDLLQRGRFAFGHGRAATRGDVTIENAHPFMISRKDKSEVILVHNGTLASYQNLPNFHDYDVDSEWLAQQIVDLGAQEALSKINGAIATIWYDTRDKTLNVYRNVERPLFFVQDKFGTFYFNSERAPLIYIKERHGLKYEANDIKSLVTDYIWTCRADSRTAVTFDKVKVDRHIEPIKPHIYALPARPLPRQPAVFGSPLHDDEDIIDLLVDGTINFVEWNNGNKIILYTGGSRTQYYEKPPEEGLVRMFFAERAKKITRIYEKPITVDGMTKMDLDHVETEADEVKKFHASLKPTPAPASSLTPWQERKNQARRHRSNPADNKIIVQELGTSFTCGKLTKFNSRLPDKTTLRHKALVSDGNPRLFQTYENDCDGRIKVGDEVMVEVDRCSEEVRQGFSYVKAWCLRLKPQQDRAIDWWFTLTNKTTEDVKAIGWYKGNISSIRLANKEIRETTGAVVEVTMCNMSAVEEKDIYVN